MRQAAGPLTENLPNVCLVNKLAVLTDSSRCQATGASQKESLHQGTLGRLFSREVCLSAVVHGETRTGERVCAPCIPRREREKLKGTFC